MKEKTYEMGPIKSDFQDDRVIYCNVHSVMYECSGVPTQFYM